MMNTRVFTCILVFVTITEAIVTFHSTSCETLDVKHVSRREGETYEDFYGNTVCCRPSYITQTLMYSYAICNYVTLNPGQKLDFSEENENLKYIVFEHSHIPLIPVGVFPSFHALMQLYLNNSHVETIHPGAFNGLTKLEELYLQNNNITELTRGTLNSLTDLKILNISHNCLSTIEENALLGLFNLTSIDFSYNNLKNMYSTIFNGLASIRLLDLSHNNISEISSNLFANLSYHDSTSYQNAFYTPTPHYLELLGLHLDLSHNRLVTVDFSHLPVSLQNLNLGNNCIHSLKNLVELPELKRLDLSNNQITDVITVPTSLNYLNVSGNMIHNLTNTLFRNLDGLTTIDLSFNFIISLHEDGFQGNKVLRFLYLQNNELDRLPIGCFRDLNLLYLLNVSSNRITEFEFGTFSGMSNLQILDISNNTLTDLFESTFHSLTSLQALSINDNFLTTFDSYDLLQHTNELETVSLNNNPWSCNSLLKIVTNFKIKHVKVLNGPAQKIRNIQGIACLDYSVNNSKELNNFERPKSNEAIEKFSVNLKELETLRKFFNEDFFNSSFYNFFKNYEHTLPTNSSREVLKYFGDDFKNTTFYKYFDHDFSNARFFKSFNETLLRYFAAVHNMLDKSLNTTLYKSSNRDELSQAFSKYFEDGYKNSSFYKYYTKEFANSGFFKFLNDDKRTVINSSLIEISNELRSLRNFFTKEFNSTFHQLFQQNHNSNLSRMADFLTEKYFVGSSNLPPSFAKHTDADGFNQEGYRDILSKLSELQNGITVLMTIAIIILLCMMLLFALRRFSNPLKRSINNSVSINASDKSESTSGLELM